MDAWVAAVMTLLGGAAGGSITALVNNFAQRKKVNAEAGKVQAETGQVEAQASAEATAKLLESMVLVMRSLDEGVKIISAQMADIENKNKKEINSLTETIETLKESITESWQGNLKNMNQLIEAGIEPEYDPPGARHRYRGDSIVPVGLGMIDIPYHIGRDGSLTWGDNSE